MIVISHGLAERPWSTEGGEIPRHSFYMGSEHWQMAETTLSIFIDESGDFGSYESHAPYYIVTMLLHNQKSDITENLHKITSYLKDIGYEDHAIHTGPLIRRESIYAHDLMENRKKLFNALFHFARKIDILYSCVFVKKSECSDVVQMTAKLSKKIAAEITLHRELYQTFDKIILYYDNGQVELTKILTSVFNALFSNVEFRKVQPVNYKLFQVADLICTLELLSLKSEDNLFSRSESEFFCSQREFKKNYLKTIRTKKL